MRHVLLMPLALAACNDGSESSRPQHMMVAAVRQAIYAVKAAPGGALAQFSDVRLYGKSVICGTVDAQDGDGPRRFTSSGIGEPAIAGSGDPAALAKIAAACKGPSRAVTSRNPGYSDIEVEEVAK